MFHQLNGGRVVSIAAGTSGGGGVRKEAALHSQLIDINTCTIIKKKSLLSNKRVRETFHGSDHLASG